MRDVESSVTDPVTRLIAYGVPAWRIKSCAGTLPKVSTIEELDAELGKQHASIDWAQLLMPVFRPIYQNEPEIEKAVKEKLAGIPGISPQLVDEYFLESSDQPYLYFHLAYARKIPLDVREDCNAAAGAVVLQTIKSYLGLATTE